MPLQQCLGKRVSLSLSLPVSLFDVGQITSHYGVHMNEGLWIRNSETSYRRKTACTLNTQLDGLYELRLFTTVVLLLLLLLLVVLVVANTFRVIKSRRMRLVVHVHVWGRGKVPSGFWCGNLRDRDLLEDPGVNGRMILKWIFRKWDGEDMDWIDLA